MAFSPHPDDVEFFCAGALLLAADAGLLDGRRRPDRRRALHERRSGTPLGRTRRRHRAARTEGADLAPSAGRLARDRCGSSRRRRPGAPRAEADGGARAVLGGSPPRPCGRGPDAAGGLLPLRSREVRDGTGSPAATDLLVHAASRLRAVGRDRHRLGLGASQPLPRDLRKPGVARRGCEPDRDQRRPLRRDAVCARDVASARWSASSTASRSTSTAPSCCARCRISRSGRRAAPPATSPTSDVATARSVRSTDAARRHVNNPAFGPAEEDEVADETPRDAVKVGFVQMNTAVDSSAVPALLGRPAAGVPPGDMRSGRSATRSESRSSTG